MTFRVFEGILEGFECHVAGKKEKIKHCTLMDTLTQTYPPILIFL